MVSTHVFVRLRLSLYLPASFSSRRSVLEDNSAQARANRPQGPQRAQPVDAPQGAQNGPNRPPGQQWQQGNNAGLLGRLMGVGDNPLGANVPVGQAPQRNGVGQPPIAPFPYGNPRGRPERFAGFFGPDGVWHAWPQPGMQEAGPVPQQNVPIPTPTAPAAAGEDRNAATMQEETASGRSSSENSSEDSDKLSPREAARAAALRRFGPSQSPASGTSSHVQTPLTSMQQESQNSHTQAPAAVPKNLQPPLAPPAPQVPGSSPIARPPLASAAPALIPLFDPHLVSPPAAGHMPYPSGAGSSSNFFGYDPTRHPPASTNGQDIRNLPSIMTEEQLHTMDRLTREAIDARIRVLDNIQTAASRMTEELLRCRSVFPPLNPQHSPTPPSTRRSEQRNAATDVENGA